PEGARQEMNEWVAEKTQERIKDFLPKDAVDAETRLVLTNAVYFKALWEKPFPEKYTKPDVFRVSPQEKVRVPMMATLDEFGYAVWEGVSVLDLPYKGGEVAMLLLLPSTPDGLERLEQVVSAERLKDWCKRLSPEEVTFFLPRFSSSSRLKLA